MCPPTVQHEMECDHDDHGTWTVTYREHDFAAQHTTEATATGNSLSEALAKLSRTREVRTAYPPGSAA